MKTLYRWWKNRKYRILAAVLGLALFVVIPASVPAATAGAAQAGTAAAADTSGEGTPSSSDGSTPDQSAPDEDDTGGVSDPASSEAAAAAEAAAQFSSSTSTGTASSSSSTSASSSNKVISDANAKINEAEQNLNAVNNQITGIQGKQNQLQSEMNALDAELSELLVNIAILEDEIVATKEELEQVNADLVVAEEKEAKEYADMKKRIQYMYENSDGALWDALLGSESFSDFLNRIEYVDAMYSYDRDLLTEFKKTVQEVKDLREAVLDTQDELEEIMTEYEAQQAALESAIERKRKESADFDVKLANAQALAREYSQTIAEQNAIIKEEQRKQEEERKRREAEEKARAEAARNAANSNTSSGSGSSSSGSSSGETMNPAKRTNVSGSDVVNYAMQFIGNPYVYGGTSLTDGCDCSGFTQGVFSHFGISLPRSSGEQATVGSPVSYDAAQPGDLVCYVGHVGIYIGNGQIVNASTPRTGIKTQSATYRPITTIRRVL